MCVVRGDTHLNLVRTKRVAFDPLGQSNARTVHPRQPAGLGGKPS